MLYFFIINGQPQKLPAITEFLDRELKDLKINCERYITQGSGDGTRFVRFYCDLHQKDEVCFVACGGSGTVNEVASGIAGFEHKSMAIVPFGNTNDFIKIYPDRDFKSIGKILEGETVKLDLIKAGDWYSLNYINCGFDAECAALGEEMKEKGVDGVTAYKKAVFRSILSSRYNRIKVWADGELISGNRIMLVGMGNGQWCGGQYHCAPLAKPDDGLIEVCLIKAIPLVDFLYMLPRYTDGTYMQNDFCRVRLVSRSVKTLRLESKNLFHLCLDGEIVRGRKFEVSILPRHISLVLPKIEEKEA